MLASSAQGEPAKPKRYRGPPILRFGLFLIVQAIVLLVLVEILARIFNPMGISFYPETARYLDTMIKKMPIGYTNRPNLRGRYFGTEVRINSLGLRDREVPMPAPENEFRILVLGDSIPFGIGVDYEDSIVHVLELVANQREAGDRHYRTINMGVPSYNTEQELIQLESLGMSLEPDLVLLFFVVNDLESKMWVFEKRASILADLAQRSYAGSFLFTLSRRLNERVGGKKPRIDASGDWETDPKWVRLDRSLTTMYQLCESADVPFVVFFLGNQGVRQMQMVRSVGKREHFAVWKLSRAADARWPGDVSLYRNSAVDGHANKDGCLAYGTLIYEKLAEKGILAQPEDTPQSKLTEGR